MKAKKPRPRPLRRGCPCPRCGAPSRCVYIKPAPTGTYRLRACPHGHRFHTFEVPAETVFGADDYTGVIRSEKLLRTVAMGLTPRGAGR